MYTQTTLGTTKFQAFVELLAKNHPGAVTLFGENGLT